MALNLAQAFGSGGLSTPQVYGSGAFAGPVKPGNNVAVFRTTGQNVAQGGGQVLGTSTGGGGGSFQSAAPSNNNPGPSAPQFDPYAQMRSDISNAWDSYLGSLGDIGSTYLPQQQTAQNDIVNSQLTQGQNTINDQKTSSLKDIANNVKNAFQAGNIYLGQRGAGDSSAANQYSFAINQEGQKQTANLNQFVNTQLNNLQSQHDQQISSIANWFSQAQGQLKQQIAQGGLGKQQDLNALSQNILNQAISAANAVKSDTSARYNALVSWAANNSHNVGELQQNIQGIPQALGMPVDQSSGQPMPVGFGGGFGQSNDKQNLFG